MPGALVVLSGGMDSAVCLASEASTLDRKAPLLALTFDYGQRHRVEIERAHALAEHYRAEHIIVALDRAPFAGSALTDLSLDVPAASSQSTRSVPVAPRIPSTYVPARNTIFLAIAIGVAESRDLDSVTIGVNAIDYSGYPDCRPEFIEAFREVARLGQRRGVEGSPVQVKAPLLLLDKAAIVRLGASLSVPFEMTWSCYRGGPDPCGSCDACELRRRGFAAAGIEDPAIRDRRLSEP